MIKAITGTKDILPSEINKWRYLEELVRNEFSKFGYKEIRTPIFEETALVMGNEEKGIRDLVAKNCDFLVHIPMKGKIQSLNVSVAAGVLLAEISNSG